MAVRRHLVVVVPGIGGSVLARPRDGKVVWDAGFGDIADLLLRPGRVSLEENPHLEPRGMISSKRLVPGWTVIDGYERLWSELSALPGAKVDDGKGERVLGANVVAFGYDFRRSIVEAADQLGAEVSARLRDLGWSGDSGDPRVIVVAHSMGGLVARYWLGPGEGWRQCRSLITLGTPHRGAPKALQVLVNGIRLRGTELSRPSNLLRGWVSPYQLLPRYRCIWEEAAAEPRYPHELPQLGLSTQARDAFGLHEEIAKSWDGVPRSGTEMVIRLGYSHPTLASAAWDGARLTGSKEPPSWLDLGAWDADLGDGTVPALSAVPLEMDHANVDGARVAEKHGRIGCLAEVTGLLEGYEGRPSLRPARGKERNVAVGVDIDELQATGEPIPLRVRIHDVTNEQAAHATVRATLHDPEGQRRPARKLLDWDGEAGMFVGELPAQPPGLYDVTIDARAVPDGGDLHGSDSFAVVDGDDLD
jgi:pimeloyl-ACP methyl ester carboxylesterase